MWVCHQQAIYHQQNWWYNLLTLGLPIPGGDAPRHRQSQTPLFSFSLPLRAANMLVLPCTKRLSWPWRRQTGLGLVLQLGGPRFSVWPSESNSIFIHMSPDDCLESVAVCNVRNKTYRRRTRRFYRGISNNHQQPTMIRGSFGISATEV